MSSPTKNKITYFDIFVYVKGFQPTQAELNKFINKNLRCVKGMQREVPDCYQDTVENFIGFYELMEEGYVVAWDETHLSVNLGAKIAKVRRDENYLKCKQVYDCSNHRYVLVVSLGEAYFKEFKEKINKKEYF